MLPRRRPRPDRHGERDQLHAHDEHDSSQPLPFTECTGKRPSPGSLSQLIPSHNTDRNQRIR